ncbi:MAG TPA: pectate lyase [Asticcacaulis sp.]|nr:pectate lyase [Asticcacaulis sp.]
MLIRVLPALLLSACLLPLPAAAKVIGTNVPAESVTPERINSLPAGDRTAWAAYLKNSRAQMQTDRAVLAAELKPGETAPPPPKADPSQGGHMPLNRDPAWYATPEARAIADTIVSFQTPAGGWSKNQNRASGPRLRGQRYANDAETMEVGAGNFDAPNDRFWTFVGTLDNNATTREMRFLALVAAQATGKDGDAYRSSFIKGVRYLLTAQYPNGGWPQVYPLEGGFHDAVTFNDNAVAEAAMLLADVADAKSPYGFVPAELRAAARAANDHAVAVILAAQVVVDGRKTIWPQQVDALTLAPTTARNYEPKSLASSESSDILLFLMRQPNPSPEVKAAIRDGVAWLKAHEIFGVGWTSVPGGRRWAAQPGAGPLWSRNYDLRTGQPIFGDIDKSIHDDVNELSMERRSGYSWYNDAAQKALTAYETWSRNQAN